MKILDIIRDLKNEAELENCVLNSIALPFPLVERAYNEMIAIGVRQQDISEPIRWNGVSIKWESGEYDLPVPDHLTIPGWDLI